MAKLEEKGILGIKGIIFDLYNTLIDIDTDEDSIHTYEAVSKWLIYQGVKISAENLKNDYKRMAKEEMKAKWEKYPEIRVDEIFAAICKSHALRDIDEVRMGVETARAFRAGSLRRFQLFPQTPHILEELKSYPKVIVSNGQRSFSEQEMKYLGLYEQFSHVIFSSDFGHKKPDPRIFLEAAKLMGREPEEIMCIGDSFDNDIAGSSRLGMKAMHIEEVRKLLG